MQYKLIFLKKLRLQKACIAALFCLRKEYNFSEDSETLGLLLRICTEKAFMELDLCYPHHDNPK